MGIAKTDLITFKVEPALAELINRVPNKSEFIRKAILGALDCICPLCQGAGVLNPAQQGHWKRFTEHHRVETCADCRSAYLQCDASLSPALIPVHE
jgi:hypothetical protein